MDLKKIIEAMGKCQSELTDLYAKVEEAEKGGDAKAIEAAKKAYDEKAKEFDGLQAKAQVAKSDAERAKAIADAEILAKAQETVDPPGAIPGGTPAHAKDHKAEEAAQAKAFLTFLSGHPISDTARDAMRPKSSAFKKGAEGVAIPAHIAKAALPELCDIKGKALPMTSVTATGTSGVNPEFRELLHYPGEAAHAFPRCRRVPTKAGKTIWPRVNQESVGGSQYGAVVVTWTGEGANKTATEAKIEQVSIDAFELSAYTEVSRTLLNRSEVGLEMLIRELFAEAIMDGVDTAILSGDGSSKPLGILHATSDVGAAPRLVADEVSYEDLVNVESLVLPQLRQGAVWLIADSAVQGLKKQTDDMGRPLFVANPGTGRYDTLLGYPVVATQRQALGTAGDVVLANLNHYVSPVEQEVVIAHSEHYKFQAGVIAFAVHILVGGKVVAKKAFGKLIDAA